MPERDIGKVIATLAGLGITAAMLMLFIKPVLGKEKVSLKEVIIS